MKSKHDIIWLENTDSTNDEVRRRISELDNLSVVSALSQSSGRGQRGNTWSSEPGKNLLFSILLRPQVQAYDQFVISQMVSLAVVDLLSSHDIEASIKWPNDIYVADKKICGILIENSISGKWISASIIGIGLNVNQQIFDPSLPNPTSMTVCTPDEQFDLHSLLDEFVSIFADYIERFCHITGGYNRLAHLYKAQLWRRNEYSHFIDNTTSPVTRFTGKIVGVSDIGQLVIENEKGELKEFAFKEISFIV